MKDENNDNKEKPIKPDEISKIDPFTISKIILLDGTILVVQNNYSSFRNNTKNSIKNYNDMGGTINLKLNQIQNSNKKDKNSCSYIEWDFPKSKFRHYSYQRNINYELTESKTEQNENNKIIKDNSRDSALNRNRKSKNYSFYESKHVSKKNNNNISDIESKNTSGIFIKNEDNYNFKEINSKDNENKEKEKDENKTNNNNNYIKININNKEKKEEIINKENNENNDENNTNINKDNKEIYNNNKDEDLSNKKESYSNKKINKDNLTFSEKIRLIKYGLLDYDSDYNISGLKNDENNIQKINRIKPLNLVVDNNKSKIDDDLNNQFNKLLSKFNENKKENKKLYDDNNYINYKKKTRTKNLNDDINRLNNFIHKNKFNYTYNSKIESNKGNSYRDLNEIISQLRKKTLNNNLINFLPPKNINGQRTKLLVLPSNFK